MRLADTRESGFLGMQVYFRDAKSESNIRCIWNQNLFWMNIFLNLIQAKYFLFSFLNKNKKILLKENKFSFFLFEKISLFEINFVVKIKLNSRYNSLMIAWKFEA